MENKLLNKKIKLNNILFILLVIVYCFTAGSEIGNSSSIYKYLILFLCIVDAFFRYRKKSKKVFSKEFKYLMLFITIIIIYTVIRSLIAEKFSFRTMQELLFLVCPMLYCYFSINSFEKEDIETNMKYGFIIAFVAYIISLGMNFNTILNSLLNASFGNSASQLESHVFCGFSLAFCMFFCYYDDNKIYKVISLLFVIMTFKRLFIVMGIVLFIISCSKKRNNPISKKKYFICAIGLIILSILYYNMMIPQNVRTLESEFNINISKLTSTRSDRMRMLENSSYETYGFGSSTEYMYNRFGAALEMDIVKIIIELGYLPVIMLIFSYLYFAKSNLYSFTFMIFLILNLILSSGLTGSFSWTLFFMSIAMTNVYPKERSEKWKQKLA